MRPPAIRHEFANICVRANIELRANPYNRSRFNVLRCTIAMNAPTDASSNIPHRFWLLSIFRSLGAGNMLVVAGPGSFEHYLDGVPQVAILTAYLNRHGWLRPVQDACAVRRYRLSEKGREFWLEGEHWWKQLSWWDQCRVRLLG